ncbi:hypothetical protein D3P07_10035 [Paenibacillus sp. 1011MAR3C5]|uniref:hypothetical protein n=1 Tax=Paenibacillus sp. 1011MAR3C5 TaxID=1675787 RepID=UPI000E6C965E|nr:hypothetical protein [Paenibacillus sp. 1011MAR3C5]RJE88341.1 hypothetical protein D3P07_10035 [Paenibacillus sp. 1011MAR3C5]
MKKMLSLVMALGLLLGIASQASAANGVYVFNPYPNSIGAVPDYIGITKPTGAYQYEIHIQETNNGSLSYYSGKINVPSSGYDIRHTLPNSTKIMLANGNFNILALVYNSSGTLIGRDVIKVTFL